MKRLSPSEAVFGFAAWLTTKEGDTIMGRSHDCAPICDLCDEFCKVNNLGLPSDNWEENLVHPKEEE